MGRRFGSVQEIKINNPLRWLAILVHSKLLWKQLFEMQTKHEFATNINFNLRNQILKQYCNEVVKLKGIAMVEYVLSLKVVFSCEVMNYFIGSNM
ncbi:MAG: hypothetical protein EOO10_05270 [Chitinophagaceae bacterium]|nr:MAG: hypothetical protein EOO10_05270 [Chitinophagaceae bacterium]